jgi:branched-chain amino acid transport system permease protein
VPLGALATLRYEIEQPTIWRRSRLPTVTLKASILDTTQPKTVVDFILSTLAASEVLRIGALNWAALTGGAEGLAILPVPGFSRMVFESKSSYAALILGYLVAVYVITKLIEGSRSGYYLFAVRDDEEAASNPLFARTAAMTLSAFLTAIGGSLFAQYFLFLDPTHVISPELSFQFALLPVIGGLGTAVGPVLGSIAITPLSEMLRSYFGGGAAGLHLAIYGFALILVMLYFPDGIAGALQRLTRQPKSAT